MGEGNFYTSFSDAMCRGIDYREFPKVRELPKGRELQAIAGVWGDYSDMRILFVDCETGERMCRTVYSRTRYYVPEIDRKGKDIEIGERFRT